MRLSLSLACMLWMISILPLSTAWDGEPLYGFSLPKASQNEKIDSTVQEDAQKSHDSDHCKRGPRGHRGERGKRGHRGPTGPTGATGFNGAEGPTGPTGATGFNGSEGPTGPTGTSDIMTYASIYASNAPTITLGSAVPFNNIAAIAGGISFTAGSSSINISETGVYEINIGMLFSASTSTTISFNLKDNAISIPGASIASPVASTIRTTEYTNSIITPLSAGDVLTLVLTTGPASVVLDGTGNVDAYITIKRIA